MFLHMRKRFIKTESILVIILIFRSAQQSGEVLLKNEFRIHVHLQQPSARRTKNHNNPESGDG